MKTTFLTLLMAVLLGITTSCKEEKKKEDVKDKVEEGVEDAKEGVEETAEDAKDAVDDAAEDVEDETGGGY